MRIKRHRKHPPARGMTLAEVAIVMGLIGLLLGALWSFVPLVYSRAQQEQMFEQILLTVNKMRGFYLGQARIPSGLTTDTAIRHEIVPPEMVRDKTATTLIADHTWSSPETSGTYTNGTYIVDDDPGGTSSGQLFRLQLLDLPLRICMPLVPRLTGIEGPSGITALTINGVAVPTPTKVTVGAASAACQGGTIPRTDRANVIFTYRLRD